MWEFECASENQRESGRQTERRCVWERVNERETDWEWENDCAREYDFESETHWQTVTSMMWLHCHFREGDHSNSRVISCKWISLLARSHGRRKRERGMVSKHSVNTRAHIPVPLQTHRVQLGHTKTDLNSHDALQKANVSLWLEMVRSKTTVWTWWKLGKRKNLATRVEVVKFRYWVWDG